MKRAERNTLPLYQLLELHRYAYVLQRCLPEFDPSFRAQGAGTLSPERLKAVFANLGSTAGIEVARAIAGIITVDRNIGMAELELPVSLPAPPAIPEVLPVDPPETLPPLETLQVAVTTWGRVYRGPNNQRYYVLTIEGHRDGQGRSGGFEAFRSLPEATAYLRGLAHAGDATDNVIEAVAKELWFEGEDGDE